MDPEWIGVVGTVLGAGVVGIIGVVGTQLQMRRSNRAGRAQREDERVARLREESLQSATKLQKLFHQLMNMTRRRYRTPPEPGLGFDELFDDDWEDSSHRYLPLISRLPSEEYRRALRDVWNGIGWNHGLAQHAGYAADGDEVVHDLADLGAEIAAAWLRGDRQLSPELATRVERLRAHTDEMDAHYEEQDQLEREWRQEQADRTTASEPPREPDA